MEIDSELSKNIVISEEEGARCDELPKQILANKEMLAWLMKECLDEYKDCTIREIADSYIENEPEIATVLVNPDQTNRPKSSESELISGMSTEDKLTSEGAITYDIRFFASAPGVEGTIKLIINVEAQNDYYPGYHLTRRGIYYCARMLSAQLGREFVNSEYDNLKKVYSIWICTQPPKKRQNTITQYEMAERLKYGHSTEERQHYDLLSVIIVNLTDLLEEAPPGILDLFSTTFSDEIGSEEKLKKMREEYDITLTRELRKEVSLMCNVSQGYMRHGLEKGMKIGEEKGMEKGEKIGMEKGVKIGEEKGKILGFVRLGRKIGFDDKRIIEELMEDFSISEKEAAQYLAENPAKA